MGSACDVDIILNEVGLEKQGALLRADTDRAVTMTIQAPSFRTRATSFPGIGAHIGKTER